MSFVPMDGFPYCGIRIILSICFLLQSVIGTSDPLCSSIEAPVEHFWTNSSSESSVLVTWDYPAAHGHNESDGTEVHNYVLNEGDFLVLKYNPCRYEKWPTLVHDPATNVYLARYDFDESFYSRKKMNFPRVKTSFKPPTRMQENVTNLPFPGWPYAFRLDGVVSRLPYRFAEVLGRTSPATPKVCAGCFRTLWTRPLEQKREVRVYWPCRVGQRFSFHLTVSEKDSNHTTTVVDERGISNDHGYVDAVIGMRSHFFQFRPLNATTELPKHSIIVVPDEQKTLKWVPSISTTIESNTTSNIRVLSWEKPDKVDVVNNYTLVWYDKKKWRENPDRSPIMDWIYIPGNRTSIKFKMVDSKEYDVGRVGLRLIANTEDSSNGLQEFDG